MRQRDRADRGHARGHARGRAPRPRAVSLAMLIVPLAMLSLSSGTSTTLAEVAEVAETAATMPKPASSSSGTSGSSEAVGDRDGGGPELGRGDAGQAEHRHPARREAVEQPAEDRPQQQRHGALDRAGQPDDEAVLALDHADPDRDAVVEAEEAD